MGGGGGGDHLEDRESKRCPGKGIIVALMVLYQENDLPKEGS